MECNVVRCLNNKKNQCKLKNPNFKVVKSKLTSRGTIVICDDIDLF